MLFMFCKIFLFYVNLVETRHFLFSNSWQSVFYVSKYFAFFSFQLVQGFFFYKYIWSLRPSTGKHFLVVPSLGVYFNL
jgi:hypothetical protein